MGSIAKRKNGAWRARYRDEAGKEHARHFRTRTEATTWLKKIDASVVTGTYVDPDAGRITFADYFNDLLRFRRYEDTSRKAAILAAGGVSFREVPMRQITPRHVRSWVAEMHNRGLAPGTIRTRVWYVRGVFREAVKDRIVASDPSERVQISSVPRRPGSMKLPKTEEVGRLLTVADDEFAVFVALCAFAGLRLGEAAALQVGDVDFMRRNLRVERQVQRIGGGQVEVRAPKRGSERTVPLAPALVDLLAAHVAAREIGGRPTAYLFAGKDGQPPHQNTIGHRWRRTREAAGLGAVRLHDLRHFFASGLINAGCDVVTVQDALGHSKASITLDTYSHLWPNGEDRTRAAAAKLMAAATQACGAPTSGLAP